MRQNIALFRFVLCTLSVVGMPTFCLAAKQTNPEPAGASKQPKQGNVADVAAEVCPAEGKQKIDRLYFMIHPATWVSRMRDGKLPKLQEGESAEEFLACLEWEKDVNRRQKEFISKMKPTDALFVMPSGPSPVMEDLMQHAKKHLGRRCIVSHRHGVNPVASWAKLEHPIKQFLDNENLEGRSQYLKAVFKGTPPEIKEEFMAEIRDTCRTHGYDWGIWSFEVITASRLRAMDIQNEFEKRGLCYDPATLESASFGEGWAQCAMTWKSMVGLYMGLSKPTENIFELSLGGSLFLKGSKLIERVHKSGAVRLFLWQQTDGRCIALFARAWCRLKDPQCHAYIPLADFPFEVWTLRGYGTKVWPADDSILKVKDGNLIVPVYASIRRDHDDEAYYLIAKGIDFKDFRHRLVTAKITP